MTVTAKGGTNDARLAAGGGPTPLITSSILGFKARVYQPRSVAIGAMSVAGARSDPFQTLATDAIAIGAGGTASAAAQATGQCSLAIGGNVRPDLAGARATSQGAIAIGAGTVNVAGASATGQCAVAVGCNTVSSSTNTVAVGYQASASIQYAIALGSNSIASQDSGIAIGYNARATTSTQTIAIGGGTNTTASPLASAQGAIAIGASNGSAVNGSKASGVCSVAIGSGDAGVAGASATADNSVAIGSTSSVASTNSVAVGNFAKVAASSSGGIAIGGGTGAVASAPQASAQGAIAIGGSNASGVNGARGAGANSVAIGTGDGTNAGASASGADAISFGRLASASSSFAWALGAGAAASSADAMAVGRSSIASDNKAMAFGYTSLASILDGLAIGGFAKVTTGSQGIAIGNAGTVGLAAAPQASAQGAIAIGASSNVAANGARASGANSVAIGSGDASVAGASASAAQAVAIGRAASAGHATAVALGAGAATTAANQIRLGTASEDVNIPGTLTLAGGAVTPGAWTSYTPTLTQSGAVTKTVTYAKYARIGKTIIVVGLLAITGPGTASNAVVIGLPVAGAVGGGVEMPLGAGQIYDASSGALYRAISRVDTTTTIKLYATNSTADSPLGVDAFTAALASGDVLSFSATYEAA